MGIREQLMVWEREDGPALFRAMGAIAKAHQGRRLCKPLVVAAMNRMAALGHKTGILTTQPKSWKGIKVYAGCGWVPDRDSSDEARRGWAITEDLAGPLPGSCR